VTVEPSTPAPRAFPRVRALSRAVRHLPLAATGAWQRFAEDPRRAVMALQRAVPRLRSPWPGTDTQGRFDQAVAGDDYAGAMALLRTLTTQNPADDSAQLATALLAGKVNEVAALPRRGSRRRKRVITSARRVSRLSRAAVPTWTTVTAPAPTAAAKTDRPLSILHVVTNSLPRVQAGSTIRTQQVAASQRACGWDAQVVTRLGFPVFHGDIAAENCHIVDTVPYHRLLPGYLPASDRFEQAYGQHLTHLAQRLRPHVIHGASDAMNGRTALAVGRALHIPVAYEARTFFEHTWAAGHGGQQAEETDMFRWLWAQHTQILRSVDVVTTLGESMRDHIVQRGVPPERVFVVPNGVDIDFLTAIPSENRASILGPYTQADLVIGSVTTMYAYEGLATTIDAAAILRGQGLNVVVLLVGDGPELVRWRELARQRHVPLVSPGRVDLDQVRHYFDTLDVLTLPRIDSDLTRWVTALKPVQAQARGVPVVGSNLPAVRETLAPGSTIAGDFSAAAWAEALASYAEPEFRRRQGVAAKEWVTACRTWPQVMSGYANAYAALGY